MQAKTPAAPSPILRRLPLVAPSAEMSGKCPPELERIARTCKTGDPAHRALVFTTLTLARRGIALCLPPGARASALGALGAAGDWASGALDFRSVRKARAALYDHVEFAEHATLAAIDRGLTEAAANSGPLAPHSAGVVRRYVALSVHHSLGAGLLSLDAIQAPLNALDVIRQLAGAIAYRDVGLGPAREPDLQRRALEQAEWESARLSCSRNEPIGATALALFHEYLGVHWNDRAEVHRLHFEDFVTWALDIPAQGAT
jgi:hypothetical protein